MRRHHRRKRLRTKIVATERTMSSRGPSTTFVAGTGVLMGVSLFVACYFHCVLAICEVTGGFDRHLVHTIVEDVIESELSPWLPSCLNFVKVAGSTVYLMMLIHVGRNPSLSTRQKWLWGLVVLTGYGMAFYWYHWIYRDWRVVP